MPEEDLGSLESPAGGLSGASVSAAAARFHQELDGRSRTFGKDLKEESKVLFILL